MVEGMSEKIAWINAFRERATQLNTYALAGDWMRLAWALREQGIELTAVEAAAWASRGYYPGEAEASIRAGITAAMDGDMEAHAEVQAGGPDALAARRIRELLDGGQLVDEADVIRVPDPTDPGQEIIVHRDDLGKELP